MKLGVATLKYLFNCSTTIVLLYSWTSCFSSFSSLRLDAIAADAGLTEKSTADLHRLGEMLHDGCVQADKEYDERLKTDAKFDGELQQVVLIAMCVHARTCVCVCVRACICVRMHACV